LWGWIRWGINETKSTVLHHSPDSCRQFRDGIEHHMWYPSRSLPSLPITCYAPTTRFWRFSERHGRRWFSFNRFQAALKVRWSQGNRMLNLRVIGHVITFRTLDKLTRVYSAQIGWNCPKAADLVCTDTNRC
jgi:hypothetical protein